MYLLEKFHLIQFFLCSAETIHFGASTGIVAPNGSGKSAILDAMQIVLHGGDRHAIDLNAQSGGASGNDGRSIKEYCLGYYRGDEHVRDHATTYLTMVFNDSAGKLPPVTIGLAIGASINEPKHQIYGRYILSGVELTIEDHMETLGNGEQVPLDWATFKAVITEKTQTVNGKPYLAKNAADFVQAMLFSLRPNSNRNVSPSAFTKGLKNALNLKTVRDASSFVRDYIVDARPIDLKDFREQLVTFRKLKAKVLEVKERIAKGEVIRDRNTKALRARMHEATYQAMVAEFQRDSHMEEREEAEEAMRNAKSACTKAQKEAQKAEQVHQKTASELIELNKQSNNDQDFVAASNLQHESRNALTPIKRNLVRELEHIVDAYAGAQQRDTSQSGWSFLSKPWKQLLDTVLKTPAGDALKIEIEPIVTQFQQVTDKTSPMLDKAMKIEAEDAKSLKELEREFKVANDQLKRANEGKSPLTDHPALMIQRLLDEQGINSTLVCDVVTVTDPSWASAIEAFLGKKNTTALLIEPSKLNDALRVYEKIPANYNPFDVLIVKPQRPVALTSLPEKSLAHLIEGSHPLAVEFIRSKLARLLQLEKATSDSPEGLTREGMLVSRDSFGRRRTMATSGLILGHQDQRAQAERLARNKKEIAEKLSYAESKSRQSKALLHAISPLLSLGQKLENIDCWLHEHADKQRELDTLAAMAKLAENPDLIARIQLITRAEMATKIAQDTMLQTREEVGKQEQSLQTATERFEELAARTDNVVRAANDGMHRPHVDAAWLDVKRTEMETTGKSIQQMIDESREGASRSAKKFGEYSATVRSDLNQYATAYQYEIVVDTSNPDAVKKLLDEEIKRLNDTELHTYEQQADEALNTSISTFKSRIAANLRSSFDDMHGQLRELNSTMSRLPAFSNNEKYHFKYAVNPGSKTLYEFIRTVADAGPENELFTVPINTPDEFSLMLEGNDAGTSLLMEDYRRFFNFEVEVRHNGIKVDTFKNRMDKGSGGEHRSPLFIVAGASLAAAYGKLHGDTSGLSLIIFDELGDKIDSTNTRAVFEYLKSLGLQPIVAAPEDALGKINESVDGYIEMYRDEEFLSIKHVRLGPDAQALLDSDNLYKHPELLEDETRRVEQERKVIV